MKIGILTQPLYCNYGGIVQCYALQETLKRLGHETVVLQREFERKYSFAGACSYYAKLIVKKIIGRQVSWHYYVSQERRDYIAQNTYRFIEQYIKPRSAHCYTTGQLKSEVERLRLDAIIVGSDQVWRPYYSPCQPNYFLDFLPDNSPIKRISYAASFGGDNWDWSPEMTEKCAKFLQKFDAVSVREQSGIQLCQEHFEFKAVQVLDPTMLLEREDYLKLVSKGDARGSLFTYVLDSSPEKCSIINAIASKTGKTPFQSMPELDDSIYNLYGNRDKAVYPPVEDWLSAFNEAEMVVTDSFHGTVFSIIFNKPFWVIGNEGRGMARFQSLLEMFGLEDRLITKESIDNVDLNAPVDWEQVNAKLGGQKAISLSYIKTALG